MEYSSILQVSLAPIIVYKALRRKKPNRYNNYKYGEYRSFETPDKFRAYSVGHLETSILENAVPKVAYDHELDLKYMVRSNTGITSSKSKIPIRPISYYEVVLCECTIPVGAKYYVSTDGQRYLSDKLIINRIVESR